MPECKLGLNDRVLLEAQGRNAKGKAIDLDDIKFHQYVMQLLIFVVHYNIFLHISFTQELAQRGCWTRGQIMLFWEM